MPDIVIYRGRHRATVVGETKLGKEWIQANMVVTEPVLTVDNEFINELAETIEAASDWELILEIK